MSPTAELNNQILGILHNITEDLKLRQNHC